MSKRNFQIYRYDPDKDERPHMQALEVELDGSERMLLDALIKLKAVDPTATVPDRYVQANFEAMNALKLAMIKSGFQGRADTR